MNESEVARGKGEGEGSVRSPRWGRFFMVVSVLALPVGYGWYCHDGRRGVAACVLGLAFGGVVGLAGRWMLRRQMTVEGPSLVAAVMLGSFFSIVCFIAGVLLLAFVWRDGVLPATLTALVFYLGIKFYEVLWAQRAPGAGHRSRKSSE